VKRNVLISLLKEAREVAVVRLVDIYNAMLLRNVLNVPIFDLLHWFCNLFLYCILCFFSLCCTTVKV